MNQNNLSQDINIIRELISSLSEPSRSIDSITTELAIENDLGIDSLQFIRFILEAEERLNRNIFNVENIAEIVTVGDIFELIQK
ncbi:acyl carrier protein [Paenibacillus illinoisensis]|uniref:Acyl carrier protein n=1 Tax=Paenibacillus illinoisensis TaxID=59845 RepID=A0ABW8HS57_9BACL